MSDIFPCESRMTTDDFREGYGATKWETSGTKDSEMKYGNSQDNQEEGKEDNTAYAACNAPQKRKGWWY